MRKIAITLAGVAVIGSLAGCGSWNDSHGRGDAPANQLSKQTVDVYPMPDEFPNIATLCDGHGHRMYVPTHNKSDVAITVIIDASCGPVEK